MKEFMMIPSLLVRSFVSKVCLYSCKIRSFPSISFSLSSEQQHIKRKNELDVIWFGGFFNILFGGNTIADGQSYCNVQLISHSKPVFKGKTQR